MEGGHSSTKEEPASYYEILSLTCSILSSSHDPAALLKKAYRRALLQNHPDKASHLSIHTSTEREGGESPTLQNDIIISGSRPHREDLLETSSLPRAPSPFYTVDQITAAYKTLSSPPLRARYDAAARAQAPARSSAEQHFRTGIETVDLDDLVHDPAADTWSRSCRCGNERGYCVAEADLEEAGEDGEVLVGCKDCSLWLRVCFAVVDE